MELFHGYTYSAHPAACAAGIATLDIYKDEGLLTRGASLAEYWGDALHSLKGLPNVIDIRNFGLMGAVELSSRDGAVGARGYDVMVDCFNRGLYFRNSGDSFALSPPLIVEKSHIDDMPRIEPASDEIPIAPQTDRRASSFSRGRKYEFFARLGEQHRPAVGRRPHFGQRGQKLLVLRGDRRPPRQRRQRPAGGEHGPAVAPSSDTGPPCPGTASRYSRTCRAV